MYMTNKEICTKVPTNRDTDVKERSSHITSVRGNYAELGSANNTMVPWDKEEDYRSLDWEIKQLEDISPVSHCESTRNDDTTQFIDVVNVKTPYVVLERIEDTACERSLSETSQNRPQEVHKYGLGRFVQSYQKEDLRSRLGLTCGQRRRAFEKAQNETKKQKDTSRYRNHK